MSTIARPLIIISFLCASLLQSAELDELTFLANGKTLVSSKHAMEDMIHLMMRETEVRMYNKGCNEKKLYSELRDHFHHQFTADFLKRAQRNPNIIKGQQIKDGSIYEDIGLKDFVFMNELFSGVKGILGHIVKIQNAYVGLDKFEHSYDYGYKYFKDVYMKGKPLTEALKRGERSESGYLGMATTSVYSYADLAANFLGIRFWNDMLAKHNDIFGSKNNEKPYFVCHAGRYKLNRKINLNRYVDYSWSEAINCSAFRNTKILNKIKATADKNGVSCPIRKDLWRRIRDRYKSMPRDIVNPRGEWYAIKK